MKPKEHSVGSCEGCLWSKASSAGRFDFRSVDCQADCWRISSAASTMLFFSYFKELVGKEVIVELKNDLAISGILHSVDQYLNIKLENTRVVDDTKYPHMVSLVSSSRLF
ncbi:hypothetical protein M758_6G122100 [Ceratodon purpureus]|nr:hypothetical protein M758_6G122100 [Ceratodon purpureus]